MTLTVAGNRQLSVPPKTTKTLNVNYFPPGFVSKQLLSPDTESTSTSIAGTRSDLGSVKSRSGMSAAAITLQASSNNANTSHSIDKRQRINCPMNIVSDTPQPYLEPIKLLNKQSTYQRQQSLAAARSVISSVLAQKTGALKQVSKSCYTGTKFPSASSRPIPPPKVLLKRQQSVKVEPAERGSRPSEEEDLSPTSANKRELAYLIVDLESGRSTIGTKNNRTLDDSDVGLTSLKEEKSSKFPVRSFTMNIPGDQIKRPVVKQRATNHTSLDSVKDTPAQSAGVQDVAMETGAHCGRENTVSAGALSDGTESQPPSALIARKERSESLQVSSAGEGITVNGLDRNHGEASPPPIPPKRGLGKMSSLQSTNGSDSATVSRMIRDALPASSLAKTKKVQNANTRLHRDERPNTSAGKTATKSSSGSPKPVNNHLPPPKPKPYAERVSSPPPPPSFPPPPRPSPVSTASSKPPSPPVNGKSLSPVLPTKKLSAPTSPPANKKLSSPVPPSKMLTSPASPPASRKLSSPIPPPKNLTAPTSPPASRNVTSPIPPPKSLIAPTSPPPNRSHLSPSNNLTQPPADRKVSSPVPPPKNFTTSTSPLASKRVLSPVPPSNKLPLHPSPPTSTSPDPLSKNSVPLQSNVGMKQSHSHHLLGSSGTLLNQGRTPRNRLHSDSKPNKPKPPKPPPPSRPPPVNPKLSQLISEHRSRSKSTGGVKAPISRGNLSISEPRLISTTMKSDSTSLTDLRILDEQIKEDDEVIPCSNVSYVASSELFPEEEGEEDRPCAVYEDIDAIIPLPPPRTDLVNKLLSARKSFSLVDSVPPELPPKECRSDPTARRHMRKKSPPTLPPKPQLAKSLSSGAKTRTTSSASRLGEQMDTVEPYYIKKLAATEDEERENDEGEAQDTGTYEPVQSPLFDNEEEELEEPDVGGVDEYVVMKPVISRAWEMDDDENINTKEDLHDSYVEMQPVAVNSPSPIGEDVSRNFYELDDEPEPVYIEMNPDEFVPPNKHHYASKGLLTNRPNLNYKQKKSKKSFTIGNRK